MDYRQGKIGIRLAEGEQVYTVTYRLTTPFPKLDLTSERKSLNTLKRVDKWLLLNAQQEAASHTHPNMSLWKLAVESIDINNMSQSDKDTCELILFDEHILSLS